MHDSKATILSTLLCNTLRKRSDSEMLQLNDGGGVGSKRKQHSRECPALARFSFFGKRFILSNSYRNN